MYILLLIVKILVDISIIFVSFSLQHFIRLPSRQIPAEDFPDAGPKFSGDSGPGELLQLVHADRRLGEEIFKFSALAPLLVRVWVRRLTWCWGSGPHILAVWTSS